MTMRWRFAVGGLLLLCVAHLPAAGTEVAQWGGTYTSWPTTWTALSSSPEGGGLSTPSLDLVGSSAYPGGYWAADDDYVYLRTRVALGTITSSTPFNNNSVLFLISNNGGNLPTHGFGWDAKEAYHGLEMMVVDPKSGSIWNAVAMNDFDGQSGQRLTQDIDGLWTGSAYQRPGEGYLRTVDSQIYDGATTSSFIDVAVAWDYLTGVGRTGGATGLDAGQDWKVTFATIQNANDHGKIGYDIAGGAAPTSSISLGWSGTITPVPEPASIAALVGLAGTGVVLFVWRKRRKSSRAPTFAKDDEPEPYFDD